jgi:transcriptional regulator with XRE-family HTH domain
MSLFFNVNEDNVRYLELRRGHAHGVAQRFVRKLAAALGVPFDYLFPLPSVPQDNTEGNRR